MRPPAKHRYWRVELERRFLLKGLPPVMDPEDYLRLRDLYVAGTSLRLRRVEAPDGSLLLAKLGQKLPDPDAPDDPLRRRMTTLYLEASEAERLEVLPGPRLVKRRYRIAEQGRTFAVDVLEAPDARAGLVLAEVECDSSEALRAIELPAWAAAEVTGDPSFTGFELARA